MFICHEPLPTIAGGKEDLTRLDAMIHATHARHSMITISCQGVAMRLLK